MQYGIGTAAVTATRSARSESLLDDHVVAGDAPVGVGAEVGPVLHPVDLEVDLIEVLGAGREAGVLQGRAQPLPARVRGGRGWAVAAGGGAVTADHQLLLPAAAAPDPQPVGLEIVLGDVA